MKYPKFGLSEKDIQSQILEWLSIKKIFHYRNNSGAFKREDGHFYRFGAVGSPDIICVIHGKYVGIEVKTTKGVQSDNQKKFQSALECAGGIYILARSLDEAIKSVESIEK